VPLTHANLLAGATSVAGSLDLGLADRVLVMWEQHHVGGLVDLLLGPLVGGGTAVCAGGFDAARFLALVDRVRPTWFQGVPATLRELLVQARQAGRLPLAGSLRFLRSVAAPLPPELMRDLEAAFGVPVIQTFGMTEAAPLITTNRLPPGLRKPGSTGTPSGCEVAVLDPAGQSLHAGATGEVAVRGPNVFAGYEDDPETNARSFRLGWFLTGDVGRFDADGFLFLTGRVKEMINRGGEKIAPAEIEEAAVRHQAVAQAAAFAIPHPTLGEDVALAVVPADTAPLDRGEIRRHLAASLSPFKVPAVVLVLDALPRCPIGKLRRRDLTALAVEQIRRDRTVATSGPAATADHADPLVVALASLWATHLDLQNVDPDADFQVLGGDSLSRIRLVIAVESLCGVSLPEDVAASASTVRAMAAAIRDLGGNMATTADTQADVWADGATAGVADLPATELSRRLADSRTMLEFEATREALLNVLTLDELAAIAARRLAHPLVAWAGRLAAATPWTGRGAERFRVAAMLVAWQRELGALAAAPNRSRWQRHPLAASVIHYRRRSVDRESDPSRVGRRLVVGFAGNHQRLMLPTHLILDHLPTTDDLLLLSDPDRRHFAAGIRGLAASLPAVCDWLAAQQASCRYDAVVTFGTSAGGLAAVCAGLALGCSRAVAVGADAPAAHPALAAMLKESLAAADRGPAVILAFDPRNRRDRAGSEAIRGSLSGCRIVTLDADGGHNTLRPAHEAGRLTDLFAELLDAHSGITHADRTAA
jgi:acyl carrier protein